MCGVSSVKTCQNCGHEAHCPEDLWKTIDDIKVQVCKKCRCKDCEKPIPEVEIVQ